MNSRYRFVLVLSAMALLCCCTEVYAQFIQTSKAKSSQPLLGMRNSSLSSLMKTVSLNVVNMPLEEVISTIAKRAGVRISYSNATLPARKIVSLSLAEATVAEALIAALQGTNVDFSIGAGGQVVLIPRARVQEETGTIVGRVLEARTNKPLPGANVVIEGTTLGRLTDAIGTFRIERVPPGKYTIRASVIGYKKVSQEVMVAAGQEVIADFFLEEGAIGLDEVVVIGYGTTSKRFSTGNISTVKAEDIAKQPLSNPLIALQGRVPGVVIEQFSGVPGSAVKVRIQGQNSILSGNDPLYVIDGTPYPSQLLPRNNTAGILLGNGSPLNFLDPENMESIDILKDADATAIYGSRGANGVILITTKKGQPGIPKINFNVTTGWGRVTRKLDMLNTQQYLEMRREAKRNDNASISSRDYDINGAWDTTRYTDWQTALIGGTARYTDISGTFSGGEAGIQYLVGGGYHKQTTVFPGDNADQKYSLYFNLNNASANQKFRIQLSGSYVYDDNKIPTRDLTASALQLPPNAPTLYNPEGSLNWAVDSLGRSTWENPLNETLGKYELKSTNLIANGVASYEILPGLEMKSTFGYTSLHRNDVWTRPLSYYAPENRAFSQRVSIFGSDLLNTWIIEPQANYRWMFGSGAIDALVGSTIQQTRGNSEQFMGRGFNSDATLEDIASAASLEIFEPTVHSVYKYNALFGRINYNWQNKYLLNLTARRDGSSRFGKNNRFHNFGSVGAAWLFSNEGFAKEILSYLAISFGKLRASYGTTGNDQIGDYKFLGLYNTVNTPVPYQGATGLKPTGPANPNLEWEETKKLQLGLELGFLADYIYFEANYFRNRSSNQLLPYALPINAGFNFITTNFPATVQNSGWEISLRLTNLEIGDFTWSSRFNLTIPRNELIDFPNLANSSYARTFVVGEPITIFRVYRFLGVDPATGKYLFADKDGNPTSTPNFLDKTGIVNTSPEWFGGFQNTVRFKGIQLDVLFQFSKQSGPNYFFGRLPGGRFNQPLWVLDRWRNAGDAASIQKYNSNFSLASQWISAATLSDAAWSDASYIRLKNLSLLWQLPVEWSLGNIVLYLEGQNLITITDFKGMDPENKSVSSLPPLRVWTTGIQVTL